MEQLVDQPVAPSGIGFSKRKTYIWLISSAIISLLSVFIFLLLTTDFKNLFLTVENYERNVIYISEIGEVSSILRIVLIINLILTLTISSSNRLTKLILRAEMIFFPLSVIFFIFLFFINCTGFCLGYVYLTLVTEAVIAFTLQTWPIFYLVSKGANKKLVIVTSSTLQIFLIFFAFLLPVYAEEQTPLRIRKTVSKLGTKIILLEPKYTSGLNKTHEEISLRYSAYYSVYFSQNQSLEIDQQSLEGVEQMKSLQNTVWTKVEQGGDSKKTVQIGDSPAELFTYTRTLDNPYGPDRVDVVAAIFWEYQCTQIRLKYRETGGDLEFVETEAIKVAESMRPVVSTASEENAEIIRAECEKRKEKERLSSIESTNKSIQERLSSFPQISGHLLINPPEDYSSPTISWSRFVNSTDHIIVNYVIKKESNIQSQSEQIEEGILLKEFKSPNTPIRCETSTFNELNSLQYNYYSPTDQCFEEIILDKPAIIIRNDGTSFDGKTLIHEASKAFIAFDKGDTRIILSISDFLLNGTTSPSDELIKLANNLGPMTEEDLKKYISAEN